MLTESKLNTVKQIVDTSTQEELIWINGYLSGVISKHYLQSGTSQSVVAQPSVVAEVGKPSRVTIAYGTETGNSKKVATELAAKTKNSGIRSKVVSLDQYRVTDLSKEECFLAVISTHGEGEPPASAKKFYDHIHQNGFKLENLKYSVLALGDTSYPLFCKAGEDVDNQLNKLGGHRIAPLKKCDLDYEQDAVQWFDEVVLGLSSSGITVPVPSSVQDTKKNKSRALSRGTVLSHINLNDEGSNKETWHIELEAEEVGYQPGDSLGITPPNSQELVKSVLNTVACEGNEEITYRDELYTIQQLLHEKLNLTYLPGRVIEKYSDLTGHTIPDERIDLIDLLRIYPLKEPAQFRQVLNILEPITPRLYSISSSPELHGNEIHITVSRNSFITRDEIRFGLCSNFLSQVKEGDQLDFYISKNNRFRLPDADKDMIMIGPGTGIAPFRSFIAERDALGATGRNWLFFGEQHFTTDFLYQTEIQNWLEIGALTHVSVAFSRDQPEKIYVQHKMKEHGKRFFEWLESGAYIYVCGQKEPMSADVEKAVLEIIALYGQRSATEAQDYLNQLKESDRYLLDVY